MARRARIGVSRFRALPVIPIDAISCFACQSSNGVRVLKWRAGDVVGVLLGDLLDVDPAHVAEQHHGLLADSVPDDARVVLVLDVGLRVDEHAARHVAVDLELEDVLGVLGGLLRRVGELHAAGLHAAACEDLGLDHGWAVDALRDRPGFVCGLGEAVLGDRDPRLGDDRAGLVFEEAHRRRGRLAQCTHTRIRPDHDEICRDDRDQVSRDGWSDVVLWPKPDQLIGILGGA